MEVVWKSRKPPISSLTSEISSVVPEKVREIAHARGLSSEVQFQEWTQPRLSQLRDPYSLLGMEKAIDRLILAHEAQEKLALYGDFDLDGTSALALLQKAFHQLGFKDFILYQPSRLTEGYGFHAHAAEKLHQEGVSLIITADVGITAVEAAQKCRELGIDLIITDHHLPSPEKPDALAIINPNQSECSSGLNHLCGVGVAFYLCWALRRKLIQQERVAESVLELKELLDCFVIGTLTDMVPLQAENRVLVKHGLLQLAQTKRPGIRYLLEELGLWGRELSSQDVAIRFAPKLNALSRMEKNLRPLDLFLVESEAEARQLMAQVLAQNELRVSLQSEAEQVALNEVSQWESRAFIFVADTRFHKGIVGLVATRLSQVCQKPAFVGAIAEDGVVVGSARAPQGWSGNLVEVLGTATAYLHRFGGHAQASGFEYTFTQHQEIIQSLDQFFSAQETSFSREPVLYDVDLELEQITPNLMKWLDILGPFGQAFEVPVFRILGVEIHSVKELRGGHRRLELRSQGRVQEALLFGPTDLQLSILNNNFLVDVLVEIQWNYFQGKKRLQLLIKDMRAAVSNEGDHVHEIKNKGQSHAEKRAQETNPQENL